MKTFFSIILAVAVSIGTVPAKQGGHGKRGGHGGYHGKSGKHFSSRSARGGQKFSRSGSKFSRGKSGKYRNWSGGNWSGDWWHHRFSGDRFLFIGGFGYPYSWAWYPYWVWSVPYAFNYGYYSNGYYPSYGYDYGYPYSWDWNPFWVWGGVPYAFDYGYYSYGSYPSSGYDYDYYGDPAYGYGYGDRSSIAQLQRRLAQAGYYYGAIDGIMGPQTRRAIRAYERAYGTLGMR
jgi:hypothetical protein